MPTAFISDIHLTPHHPASTRLFEAFLKNAHHLTTLYILGDLFDYWIGDDATTTLGHSDTVTALQNLTTTGTKIYFMPGNRDFLVGNTFTTTTGITPLPDPTVITLHNRRLLLTHGDSLCTDDTEHQQSRRRMLSAKWQNAFLHQPIPHRLTEAATMRAASQTAKRTKPPALMDVNQTAVETLMQHHKTTILIHGHTHKPAIHHFLLPSHNHHPPQPAHRYVLGDWGKRPSALYSHPTHLALKR